MYSRNERKYVVTYALRNLTLVPSLRSLNCPPPPLSLSSFMRQNFPLMSNSRIDDFYIIPFLFLSSLSSLCCTYDYCICTIAVVLNFHISAPRRKNRGGEGEKGETHTYRFLVTAETWYRCCSYEKRILAKKGLARSRVFRRAINWSAPLCLSCREKERECHSGQRWL